MSEMTVRTELYRQLPLATPFSVHMFVSYFCNFKCRYCLHALSDKQLAVKGFQRQMMEFSLYKKAIDDIAGFDEPLKALIFAGHGEPLLHRNIARMVAYAKERSVARRVEIVSNGSMLTPELSDALIAAGLDRLRISVQGIDGAAYARTMGHSIDYERLKENIAYFYRHKKRTEVYCKIIDVAMNGREDESEFYRQFAPICDEAAIEYEIPFVHEVDNAALKGSFDRSKQGNAVMGANVCAMPFYMLVVTPNGDVVPCCSTDVPIVYGNVREMSLTEIWQSPRVKGFARVHLLGNRERHPVCSICSVPQYGMQTGDCLDGHEAELLPFYQVKWGV